MANPTWPLQHGSTFVVGGVERKEGALGSSRRQVSLQEGQKNSVGEGLDHTCKSVETPEDLGVSGKWQKLEIRLRKSIEFSVLWWTCLWHSPLSTTQELWRKRRRAAVWPAMYFEAGQGYHKLKYKLRVQKEKQRERRQGRTIRN